jgi:hypothetical protein
MTSPRGSLGSQISCPSDKPILDERVDVIKLNLIKYNDGTGEKQLRIKKEIFPRWRDLALCLGFRYASIEAFAQSPNSVDAMLAEWLRTDTNSTWRMFIMKMSDAGLTVAACDLKYALCFIINDP